MSKYEWVTKLNPKNPFKMILTDYETNPYDVLNCLKCGESVIVPSHVYEIWVALDYGCPFCIVRGEEE
jgi:hypothetical protein